MTTVCQSSDGYFQQDNAPSQTQIISDWFLEHDNEFTLLKWPPPSPDLNLIEHLCDVMEREIPSKVVKDMFRIHSSKQLRLHAMSLF